MIIFVLRSAINDYKKCLKKSEIKTRREVNSVVFGSPEEFCGSVLPTYDEVMKCYLHVKQNLKPSRSSREPTVSEIGDIIAKKLEDIWLKAFTPIMSRSRI